MRGDEIDNDLTVFLARRALSVDPASLPEDILIIARHCLLDWFTLALTSWHTPAVSQLEQFLGNLACSEARQRCWAQAFRLRSTPQPCSMARLGMFWI